MHYFVEITFDGVHANDAKEAALLVHKQIVAGSLIAMHVLSEDGTDAVVNVNGDGTVEDQ